jgi:hypothetical protein
MKIEFCVSNSKDAKEYRKTECFDRNFESVNVSVRQDGCQSVVVDTDYVFVINGDKEGAYWGGIHAALVGASNYKSKYFDSVSLESYDLGEARVYDYNYESNLNVDPNMIVIINVANEENSRIGGISIDYGVSKENFLNKDLKPESIRKELGTPGDRFIKLIEMSESLLKSCSLRIEHHNGGTVLEFVDKEGVEIDKSTVSNEDFVIMMLILKLFEFSGSYIVVHIVTKHFNKRKIDRLIDHLKDLANFIVVENK